MTAPTEPAAVDRRPPWVVVIVALALAAVSLVAAAAALLVGSGGDDGRAIAAARSSALQAATERTTELTSYDHRTLDADTARVLATATGEFKADYTATSAQLRPAFVSTQAVATAKVVAAGLESASADRAVAIVAVDQVITTRGMSSRTERNRLRMTLVRPDRTWLVERVERL